MAMQIISGITAVAIDGQPYATTDGAVKFEMATINREPKVSKSGAIFFAETPQPAKISFSIFVPTGVDISTFNSLTNSHIVVQTANGNTLIGSSFAASGNVAYDSNEGTVELEFFGPKIVINLGN